MNSPRCIVLAPVHFRPAIIAGLFLLLAAPFRAQEIAAGDSYDKVLAALGQPSGELCIGNETFLTYDRGEVKLQDGRVISSDLMSVAQVEKRDKRRAAQADEEKAKREKRVAEGTVLRAETLANVSFAAQPAGKQVAFWQDFRRRYPEVPCDDVYVAALNRSIQEQEAQRTEARRAQQVAELSARVADTEARAAQAEQTAQTAAVEVEKAEYSQPVEPPPDNLVPTPAIVYAPVVYPVVYIVRPSEDSRHERRERLGLADHHPRTFVEQMHSPFFTIHPSATHTQFQPWPPVVHTTWPLPSGM